MAGTKTQQETTAHLLFRQKMGRLRLRENSSKASQAAIESSFLLVLEASCFFCVFGGFFSLRCSRAARGRAETDHQCASCPFSAAPGTGMRPAPICQLPDSTISGILNRRRGSASPTTGQLGLRLMWLTNAPILGPTPRAALWMKHSELAMVLGGAKWATAPKRHILVCWRSLCFCPCLGFCFCLFLLFCPFFVYIRGSPIFSEAAFRANSLKMTAWM